MQTAKEKMTDAVTEMTLSQYEGQVDAMEVALEILVREATQSLERFRKARIEGTVPNMLNYSTGLGLSDRVRYIEEAQTSAKGHYLVLSAINTINQFEG